MIGIWHFVQDVGIINGDADGKPEHLLPGFVWFMRNEIPRKHKERKEEVGRKLIRNQSQEEGSFCE